MFDSAEDPAGSFWAAAAAMSNNCTTEKKRLATDRTVP